VRGTRLDCVKMEYRNCPFFGLFQHSEVMSFYIVSFDLAYEQVTLQRKALRLCQKSNIYFYPYHLLGAVLCLQTTCRCSKPAADKQPTSIVLVKKFGRTVIRRVLQCRFR
jgi:hypothetical protein